MMLSLCISRLTCSAVPRGLLVGSELSHCGEDPSKGPSLPSQKAHEKMSGIAIEFNHVWKKFNKGESHDSLRDLLPAVVGVLFSRNYRRELHEGEFWALKDVSLQLRCGAAFGVIGPNGAGKSTILKLLCGILKPTAGTVKINGKLSALIDLGAGFHPDLTGRENIYLNGTILGMKKPEIDKKLEEIIAFSGLEDFIDTPVKRYSSGMYARLGFSVAAHVDAEVLLVDEVLSIGDFPFQTKCLQRMKQVISEGTTVVYISHNIPSVIELCPQAMLLSKGQILRFGPSADVSRFYYRAYAEMHRADTGASIKMDQAELLSGEGTPCCTFQPAQWATLRVTVTSSEAVRDLVMSLFIKRSDGLLVFDTSSDRSADKHYSFEVGETRAISVGFRINLLKGTYFLGVNFLKPEKGFYMYEDEALEFHVTAPIIGGCAFVDTEWE